MRKVLSWLFKSKDGKTVLANFSYLSLLQLFSMALPLFTMPYVIRVIGESNYGVFGIATSLNGYFISLIDYSFNVTATREVAHYKDSPNELQRIYNEVTSVKIINYVISAVAILAIAHLVPKFYKHIDLFYIIVLGLSSKFLFTEWFFQGIEKMKVIALIKIVVQLIFGLSIFVLVRDKSHTWIYASLIVSGGVVSGFICQYYLRRDYGMKFTIISWRDYIKSLKKNFSIFVNQFFPTLYNNSATFILAFFCSDDQTGVFYAVRKVIDLLVVILRTLSRAVFPFFIRTKSFFKEYKALLLIIGVGLALFCILLRFIILERYLNLSAEEGQYVMILLSLSVIGYVLYDIFGMNYFIVHKEDALVMKNTILSSIIGFLILIPSVYYFGIIGAAFAVFAGRMVMGGGLYLRYLKQKNVIQG